MFGFRFRRVQCFFPFPIRTKRKQTRPELFCFPFVFVRRYCLNDSEARSHYSRRYPISKSPAVCLLWRTMSPYRYYTSQCKCQLGIFIYLSRHDLVRFSRHTYTLLGNLVWRPNLWRIKWYVIFNNVSCFFFTYVSIVLIYFPINRRNRRTTKTIL